MSNHNSADDQEEEPLDPAVERVRVKLRRLLGFSTSIMLLGFASVLAAIIYKINENDGKEAYAVPAVVTDETLRKASFPIPAGSEVTALEFDGDRLAVSYKGAESNGILLIDVPSWQVFAEMELPASR